MASSLRPTPLPSPAITGALAKSRLFAELTPPERERLASYFSPASFAAGAVVIAEGARERDMFVVVQGVARLRRGALELGLLAVGEHFGELGLIAARPRAATVLADTDLQVARLGADGLDALSHDDPGLALRMLRAIVGGLGGRLSEMTDSVGRLLSQHSLPHRTEIRVRRGHETIAVGPGTPVGDLLAAPPAGEATVAALVDRRAVSLRTPIVSDCVIEPLTTAHWEGRRILRESLALLLLEAARRLDPSLVVHAGQHLGMAVRIRIPGAAPDELAVIAPALEAQMRALVDTDVHLREERWGVDEALAHFAEAGWADAVELLSTWRGVAVPIASYGEANALELDPLVPRAGLLTGFHVVPEEEGVVLVFGAETREPGAAPEVSPEAAQAASRQVSTMTREHQRWLETLDMGSVGEFNRACIRGNVSQLIRVSEGFQEKRIGQIADEIRDRGDVRIVCVAGPSSSGKTTFIKRLTVQLQVDGIDPVGLSLDDYYVDREQTPRDEGGDYDYEALEALRLDLLGDHLARLDRGEPVQTARYDFTTGQSHAAGGPTIALGRRQILVLEGIHGLNPRLLSASGARGGIFRVFICPLSTLPFDRAHRVHASDLRLLRRVVRDRHARGSTAASNIARWPSVRRGERRHIFPFQAHADAVFDSSLIYEMSVLKVFAERYLLEVPQEHPSYTTAFRLLGLTDRFVTIYPDHVPPTSILREFIGGSGFEP